MAQRRRLPHVCLLRSSFPFRSFSRRVGCRSTPIRETRRDTDISPGVAPRRAKSIGDFGESTTFPYVSSAQTYGASDSISTAAFN